tara:strand:- start:220 stop:870 length:651 start_codon:yes stop_codon:yes gene_type:complete
MAIILGAAANGNDLYSVPTSWPWALTSYLRTYAFEKNGTNAPAARNVSQSGFWNVMTANGAVDTGVSRTADTYRTQVDITGEGHMGTIIFPFAITANITNTARITVDGVQYVCVSAPVPTQDISVLGFMDVRYASTSAPLTGSNTVTVEGITVGDFTDYTSGVLVIAPVSQQIALGTPVLRFKESLKVELKQSVTSYAGNYLGYSTVQYRLTGDVS